jgi:hypothetical protein
MRARVSWMPKGEIGSFIPQYIDFLFGFSQLLAPNEPIFLKEECSLIAVQ